MAKIVAAMRFLPLASTLVHKSYLCDGSVALEAISQGHASFNTQINGADIDLFHMTAGNQCEHTRRVETQPACTVSFKQPQLRLLNKLDIAGASRHLLSSQMSCSSEAQPQ